MRTREEDLKIYLENKWKLLDIWEINEAGECACGRENCHAPGKHPVKGPDFARVYRSTLSLRHNVGVMCGESFVVLDIDPRNGGNETLAALEAEHGPLPPTWTVSTGGGGEHRYFSVPGTQAAQDGLKTQGLELKGVGRYVLCPSSNHASGRLYEWLVEPEDCELAPLPAWLLEATNCQDVLEHSRTLDESRDSVSERYSREDVCCALKHISSDCSEKEWKDIACALISGGFGMEMFDEWSYSTANKYPGKEEIEKVWNQQVARCQKLPAYRKITLGTLIYRAKQGGWNWEPPQLECPIVFSGPTEPPPEVVHMESTCDEPSNLRLKAQGIIGELACWMYDTSVREYDEFSVAGALAILSTCAQGTYRTWDDRTTSLYQICLLPAAGGKDHYLTCVQDVLRKIDGRLVMSMPGSSHGMRGDFFAFNSRILCMDEVQDFFSKMGATDNVFVSQVMSDIKELYNGKKFWDPSSLKTQMMPAIEEPKLTWVGFGTPARFKQTINSNMAGGGLLSRILMWDVEDVPRRHRTLRKRPFDPDIIGELRRMFLKGVKQEFIEGGMPKMVESLKIYHAGKECTHKPQTEAQRSLTITKEAADLFAQYDTESETSYIANPDSADGAILDRTSTQVAKIASLHALGCRRLEVQLEDVEFAIAVAERTIKRMAAMARTWMADSPGEKMRQRILHALGKGQRTRHHLLRSLRMSVRDFDQAASDLIEMKLVESDPLPKQGHFSVGALLALANKPHKC